MNAEPPVAVAPEGRAPRALGLWVSLALGAAALSACGHDVITSVPVEGEPEVTITAKQFDAELRVLPNKIDAAVAAHEDARTQTLCGRVRQLYGYTMAKSGLLDIDEMPFLYTASQDCAKNPKGSAAQVRGLFARMDDTPRGQTSGQPSQP